MKIDPCQIKREIDELRRENVGFKIDVKVLKQ